MKHTNTHRFLPHCFYYFDLFAQTFIFFFHRIFTVGAGTNKQHGAVKNTAKLDRETEELKHKAVPSSVAKLIQQGRMAKGLSQKDLATVS
jgi:hypothetical protein